MRIVALYGRFRHRLNRRNTIERLCPHEAIGAGRQFEMQLGDTQSDFRLYAFQCFGPYRASASSVKRNGCLPNALGASIEASTPRLNQSGAFA